MWTFSDVLKNFFTHKDFLPSADKIPGTLFTPLHLIFALIVAAGVVGLIFLFRKKSERTIKILFICIWATLVVFEGTKIIWETFCGKQTYFFWGGYLPLYPCSLYMFAMPFAIWGKGKVRYAACGYVCTLGLIGGLINFVYPANVVGTYSCISFAGLHTFLYHGMLVFTAFLMLVTGYHSFTKAETVFDLFLPFVPCLLFSIPVHIANGIIGSDYMFFRCNSFFLAPIGAATPDLVSTFIMYVVYFIAHVIFYLPSYIKRKVAAKKKTND